MSGLIRLCSLLLFIGHAASDCNQNLCVAGCGSFDAQFNSCNFDDQVYSSYEDCICAGDGTTTQNELSLLNCISCNTNGIGSNTLDNYSYWAVICGVYETEGEAAAISIRSGPADARISFYSTSILPVIESMCPEAFGAAATSTPLTVSTSTMVLTPASQPSSTQTPTSQTTSQATTSTSTTLGKVT